MLPVLSPAVTLLLHDRPHFLGRRRAGHRSSGEHMTVSMVYWESLMWAEWEGWVGYEGGWGKKPE